MKFFYTLFLLLIIFFSRQVFAEVVVPDGLIVSSCVFTETLRVGSLGGEVKCVQSIVGAVADGHFGPLTKAAVVKWQAKMGLSPDGVVGPHTRNVLTSLVAAAGNFPTGCTSTTGYSPTTGKKCGTNTPVEKPVASPPSSAPVFVPGTSMAVGSKMPESLKDPQKNLETYIASVKTALAKRGESSNTISLIEENIRKSVAENPNATKQFFDAQREIYNKTTQGKVSKLSVLSLLDGVFSFFSKTFSANKVMAAEQLPFGGFIGVFPVCTCTGEPPAVVQLYVSLPSAPPGISNMTLNYATGTQAFLNYNIPEEGIAVLGFYNPAANEACVVTIGTGCGIIPAEGQILPIVGSSLTP